MKILRLTLSMALMTQAFLSEASTSEATRAMPGFRSIEEAIGRAEISKRLTPENEAVVQAAANNQEQLEKQFGKAFAGTWIDYDNSNNAHQVLALTDSTLSTKALENPRFKVVYVRYDWQTLTKLHDEIHKRYVSDQKFEAGILSTSIDVKSNVVVVFGAEIDFKKIQQQLISDGYDLNAVQLRVGGASRTVGNLQDQW